MQFGNPEALWLLALWPLLALLGWSAFRWRSGTAGRLGAASLIDRLYSESAVAWRRRRLTLMLAAAALLTLAAARPQYGEVEVSMQGFGTNVLIGMDCSRSMLAQDVKPSRLEAARKSFASFLRSLDGNRVGVMAFAGDAVLDCPMTLDNDMAREILESLDTESVGVRGTDLGRAIDVACEAFTRGAGEGSRVLVLITDGDDLEAGAEAAAKKAAGLGIVIDAIGLGDERGAPIDDGKGGFIEDAQGTKVNSRLRMDILGAVAKATGGIAIAAGANPQGAIDQIAAQIAGMHKTQVESRKRTVHIDRFEWFVVPALLLLVWMLADSPVPRGKKSAAPAPSPAAAPAAPARGPAPRQPEIR